MVDKTMQDYWTIISAHRRGDPDAFEMLEMMAEGYGKPAEMAARFVNHQRVIAAT